MAISSVKTLYYKLRQHLIIKSYFTLTAIFSVSTLQAAVFTIEFSGSASSASGSFENQVTPGDLISGSVTYDTDLLSAFGSQMQDSTAWIQSYDAGALSVDIQSSGNSWIGVSEGTDSVDTTVAVFQDALYLPGKYSINSEIFAIRLSFDSSRVVFPPANSDSDLLPSYLGTGNSGGGFIIGENNNDRFEFTITSFSTVPEPSSILLLGSAFTFLALRRRR